ncbi:MAG TPA: hypothetical protein VF551_01165, partial [Chthoniobacterales bacterium]
MNSCVWQIVVGALLAGSFFGAASAQESALPERKIIYYGWNTRDSVYVRDHWTEMEQMPFDGIAIGVALDRSLPTTGDRSTGNLLGWHVFGAKAYELERFGSTVADLRTPEWQRFTDNFLPLAIATRDQDQALSWFDDARWSTIENNWRVLLTIARDGGCRGLLLDPEHYDYECELFNYRHHQAQRVGRSFQEYESRARARGRQLAAAVREIYPEITIGFLYGYSLGPKKTDSAEQRANARYALLPAFLDGLLEASAPGAKFVDFWEHGHGYQKRHQFTRARAEVRKIGKTASALPEVYARAVSSGMSLRIDYSHDAAPWQASDPEQNYFSPAAFTTALRAALETTDRYVWIYSEEKPQFFPPADLPQAYIASFLEARQPVANPAAARFAPLYIGLASAVALGFWLPVQRARRSGTPALRRGSMRILIVTGIFPPDRGGPASYVPKIAAALEARGHELEVVCLSDSLRHPRFEYAFPLHRIARRR